MESLGITKHDTEDVLPCLWCGEAPDHVEEMGNWTGMRYQTFVWRIQHWCSDAAEGRRLYIEIKARSRAEVIEFWNNRRSL